MKPLLKPPSLPAPKMEIINLIDVLITLIAFFMFTTVFATKQTQLKIQPPAASQSESDQAATKIDIGLTKDNEIFIAGHEMQPPELLEYLQKNCHGNELIIVTADRACQYEWVIDLMDLIRNRGLSQVALRVHHR